MENGSYNKISGRKTLVLVTALIALILIMTVYSVFLIFRKTSVLTKSTSFDKPIEMQKAQVSPTDAPIVPRSQNSSPDMPTRFGD